MFYHDGGFLGVASFPCNPTRRPDHQVPGYYFFLMRPSILNPLFASISSLKGVGPGLEKTLSHFLATSGEDKASKARIIDLLFHLPSGFLDRRRRYMVRDLPDK